MFNNITILNFLENYLQKIKFNNKEKKRKNGFKKLIFKRNIINIPQYIQIFFSDLIIKMNEYFELKKF